MIVALNVELDFFLADNNRSRMTAEIPVNNLPIQLGLAVSVVNRDHSRDSGLPCRQTPVKVGMVEVAMHQINTLAPNKIVQSRHHATIPPSLLHEAQLHRRNIHGGQPVAHHSTFDYTANERCKTLVV